MATYQVEILSHPGHNRLWVIRGLRTCKDLLEMSVDHPDLEEYPADPQSNTCLWLVGLSHSCDSPADVASAVFSALYDERQINENLRDGDVFEVPATRVNRFLSHSDQFGAFDLPALRFRCSGVHVVPDDIATKKFLDRRPGF